MHMDISLQLKIATFEYTDHSPSNMDIHTSRREPLAQRMSSRNHPSPNASFWLDKIGELLSGQASLEHQ
jgi:hypothetical protein